MDSENELLPFPEDSIIVDLDYEYNPFDLIITALEISSEERGIEKLIKIELKNIDEYQFLINNFLTQIVFCSFYQNKCKISTKNWHIAEKIPQLILASQIDEENNIVRFLGVMTSKEFEKYYLNQKSLSIPINEFEGGIDLLFDYVNCLELKSIPIGSSLIELSAIDNILNELSTKNIINKYNLSNRQKELFEIQDVKISQIENHKELINNYLNDSSYLKNIIDSNKLHNEFGRISNFDLFSELNALHNESDKNNKLNMNKSQEQLEKLRKNAESSLNKTEELQKALAQIEALMKSNWQQKDEDYRTEALRSALNVVKIENLEDKYAFFEKIVCQLSTISQKEELKIFNNFKKKEKLLKKPFSKRSSKDFKFIENCNRNYKRIISANLRFLLSTSKEYVNECWDLFALCSYALPILELSIEKFNPEEGIEFSDYAKQEINKFLVKANEEFNIEDLRFVQSYIDNLSNKLGFTPNHIQIINNFCNEPDFDKKCRLFPIYQIMFNGESEIFGLIYNCLTEFFVFDQIDQKDHFEMLYDFYLFADSMFYKDYPQSKSANKSEIKWWYFFNETSSFFKIKDKISDISKMENKEKFKDYTYLLKKEYQEILELRFGFNNKHLSFNTLKKYLELSSDELISLESNVRKKLKELIFNKEKSFANI